MNNVLVSQLTEYEKRRLNKQRTCPLCNKRIHDYDKITFYKRRDCRRVEYVFCHYECEIEKDFPDVFKYKGDLIHA